MRNRTANRAEHIIVPMCGILFLASGIYMGVVTGADIVFWLKMRNATEVRGRLLKVELVGDDIPLGTVVSYSYRFGKQIYTGNRATIHQEGDNFGTFQRDLYNRLQNALEAHNGVPVFVNPDQPSMSALDITPRFPNVAYPLFYSVGATAMGLLALFLRPKNPAQPSSKATSRPQYACTK
jgi:hypothetical protein